MPDIPIPTPWHHTNPAVGQGSTSTGVPSTSLGTTPPMDPFAPPATADTPWAPPQWTRPSLGGGYPAALDDSRREIVIPAADGPVTIAFGRVRVAPVVELLHTHIGHYDYAVLVWGLGEIDAVEEVSFGADAGSDVDGNGLAEPTILASYTGSLTQTASNHLTALASGLGTLPTWPFAMPGKAYSVARASEGQDLSLINSARAIVRGLKVYDPRVSSGYTDRRYSRNPVLFAGTLFAAEWSMKAGYGSVDWDRIADAADYCDVSVGGEPRFAVDVWARQGMSLKTWLNTLALHCRGYWGRSNGLWYFDVRRPRTSVFTFTDRSSRPTIAPESVRITGRNRSKEPSSVVVDWLDPESWKTGVPVVVPNPRSTVGIREARIQLPWCTSRSMARRIGVYELGQRTRHPAKVSWTAPDAAQAVQVGDVGTLDVDGLLDQVEVEVEQVRKGEGSIQFVGTGYSSSKFGDVSEVPDTHPGGWVPPGMGTAPDSPTAVNQEFIEAGPWDRHNLIPDEDDLTSWSQTRCTITVAGDGSVIASSSIGVAKYQPNLGTSDTVLVSFVVKGSGDGARWGFHYFDGLAQPVRSIKIDTSGPRYARYVGIFKIRSGAAQSDFYFQCDEATASELTVMDVRIVGWSFRPGLSLLENWSWTEHVNAPNTVRRYELIRKFPDDRVQVLASASVGSTSLEAAVYSGGAIWGGASWTLLDGSVIRMRAVGHRGRMVEFDADTQSVGTRTLGDVAGDLRDFDETEIAAGKLVVVQADAKTKGYIAQGSGGGLDADTLDGVHLSGVALTSHDHDSRYVRHDTPAQGLNSTQQSNARANIAAAATSHNHNGTYLGLTAKAADSDKLDGLDSTAFALSGHNHSGVYAPLSHTHDDRYYTETEIDSRLSYPKGAYYSDTLGRWSLVASVGNTDPSKYRFRLWGTHFSMGHTYMQEIVLACRTLGTGSPTVSYTHIGSTSLLRAGVQIYTADSGATFQIYVWSGQYGLLGFEAERTNSAIWYAVNPGDFTTTAPSGTKVFDSTDHTNHPPTFLAGSDIARPLFKGGALALYNDLIHNHDSTYAARSLWSAKGVIVAATAQSSPVAVAPGSNGLALVANSGLAAGVGYAQLGEAGIADNAVTPAKMADMGAGTLLGRQSGAGTGDPSGLDGQDITKIITLGTAGMNGTFDFDRGASIYRAYVTNGVITSVSVVG